MKYQISGRMTLTNANPKIPLSTTTVVGFTSLQAPMCFFRPSTVFLPTRLHLGQVTRPFARICSCQVSSWLPAKKQKLSHFCVIKETDECILLQCGNACTPYFAGNNCHIILCKLELERYFVFFTWRIIGCLLLHTIKLRPRSSTFSTVSWGTPLSKLCYRNYNRNCGEDMWSIRNQADKNMFHPNNAWMFPLINMFFF